MKGGNKSITVHVVAWEYNGGGGFEWYRNSEYADTSFNQEKKNVVALAKDNWQAYRFDARVRSTKPATREIEKNLPKFLAKATRIHLEAIKVYEITR